MRKYLSLFPDSALSKCVRGYLLYSGQPLVAASEEADESAIGVLSEDVDAFDLALVRFHNMFLPTTDR